MFLKVIEGVGIAFIVTVVVVAVGVLYVGKMMSDTPEE